MFNCLHKLKQNVAAVLFFVLVFTVPAFAQDEDELFKRLQHADTAEAMQIERELVLIWSRSGSDAMDLLLERGRRAMNAGEYQTAIEHLTALTDHAPEFAEGWNARATAYFHAGLYGPSISDIARTLSLNPRHFGAMSGLAIILEEIGDYQRALDVTRQVEAIHPARRGVSDAIQRLTRLLGGAAL